MKNKVDQSGNFQDTTMGLYSHQPQPWEHVVRVLVNQNQPVVQDFAYDLTPIQGYYWHRGEIKNALGVFKAWILKDHESSGEHSGTIVYYKDKWCVQGVDTLPKTFFPYQYRLDVPVEDDIHQSEMF